MLVDRDISPAPGIQDHLGPPGRAPIRVMLVEDHPLVLSGIRALLDAEPDIQVVAACGDGQEAVDRLGSARPDVVVTDLSMPGLDGAETTRRLLDLRPDVRVLVHTAAPHGRSAARALAAGAEAVLAKTGDLQHLIATLRPAG